ADDRDSFRQRRGQAAGELVEIDGFGQHEVDVLRVALVTGRQRETEADLRPGREPFRERERELRDPERSLEGPGDVAVADPAHLPELRVPEPNGVCGAAPHAPAPVPPPTATAAGFVPRNRTGASVAGALRSWPVPCDPPAGAVVAATTCSRA